MAILYPTSLANLVVEVGTRHCHQTLFRWSFTLILTDINIGYVPVEQISLYIHITCNLSWNEDFDYFPNFQNFSLEKWLKANKTDLKFMQLVLMTMRSSNENICRLTGSLCGEITGDRWIPLIKASDAELWCFLDLRLDKQLSKKSKRWWFKTPSRPISRRCNAYKCQHDKRWTIVCKCRRCDVNSKDRIHTCKCPKELNKWM